MRARDELGRRHRALLEGSYDCVDRVVLNAYMPPCRSPGGPRFWWRLWHKGSDASLDDTHLVHLAGRFARGARAWGEANGVLVLDCQAGERKHSIAKDYCPSTRWGPACSWCWSRKRWLPPGR